MQALFFLPVLKYGARRSIVPVNLTVNTHMTDYCDHLCFLPARASRGLSLLPAEMYGKQKMPARHLNLYLIQKDLIP